MSYLLEDKKEFARLEEQSNTDSYNFKRELSGIQFPKHGTFLDAGCGSGIVARYLAHEYPTSQVVGCDASALRIEQARESVSKEKPVTKNLSFDVEDLSKLRFSSNHFDVIIARFVLEHLSAETRSQSAHEMFRVLKPGGQACLIDIDGYLFNLYPCTPVISELLAAYEKRPPVDIWVGRKLPELLCQAGFEEVRWRVETMQFNTPELLKTEVDLIEQRFAQTIPVFAELLGSEKRAILFQDEYLSALKKPGTVLFYNKFIVTGKKPAHLKPVRSPR